MSKEAEISCHDTHLCQKSSKSKRVMYLRCVSLTKTDLHFWKLVTCSSQAEPEEMVNENNLFLLYHFHKL